MQTSLLKPVDKAVLLVQTFWTVATMLPTWDAEDKTTQGRIACFLMGIIDGAGQMHDLDQTETLAVGTLFLVKVQRIAAKTAGSLLREMMDLTSQTKEGAQWMNAGLQCLVAWGEENKHAPLDLGRYLSGELSYETRQGEPKS